MQYSLLPSLPAQTFEELERLAETLAGVTTELQIDIVDGVFVPLQSWPFSVTDNIMTELQSISTLPTEIQYEMDCMVMQPEQYLDLFVSLSIKRVIIHMGSTTSYEDIISHARAHNYAIGFAITNDVPLSDLYKYISEIDFVQVMGIAKVGKQGQPLDIRTLSTIKTLRDLYPELDISVDGAVNFETIADLKKAGANRFAPGSVIARSESPVEVYKQLQQIIAS